MPYESPAASDRSTALRRGLLFLLVTAPLWAVPRISKFPPAAVLGMVLGATLLFLWWDRDTPAELGLEASWRPPAYLVGGMLGGVLFTAIVAALLYAMLPFTWSRNPGFLPKVAATSLGVLLLSNAVEELLFRGYGFKRLIDAIGLWPAQLLVAALYGVYYVVHGWTWQTAFVSPVIGSLLFGLVFVRTRSVVASTGFHAATNWARGLVLRDPPTTTSWLSPVAGRRWTPMESQTTLIILNVVALVGCVLLYWSIRRRDRRLATSEA